MNTKLMTIAVATLVAASTGTALAASGTVVNYCNRPVPNAKIYAFRGDTRNSKKILINADKNGKFAFNPSKPGRYYYLADVKGYGFAMACDKKGSPGPIKLKVWPETTVSGQIIDPDGKAVENARVSIHAFDAWDDTSDEAKGGKPWIWLRDKQVFVGFVKTDKNGKFAINRIPDPAFFNVIKLRLDVVAPGRAISYRYFNQDEVSHPLTIVSSLACTLKGRVHIPADSSIAPQTLAVQVRYSLPGAANSFRTHYLDKNGNFAFHDLPEGKPTAISLGTAAGAYDDQTGQPMISSISSLSDLPMPTLAPGQPKHILIAL